MTYPKAEESGDIVKTVLQVIANELGVDQDDLLEDDVVFSDIGVDALSGPLIAKSVNELTNFKLPSRVFDEVFTIGHLKDYVASNPKTKTDHRLLSKLPLSVLLQKNSTTASKNVFLFPDGAGSAMAYAQMSPLPQNCCLYGMNSPFLQDTAGYTLSIQQLAAMWVREILKIQPKGPYTLGGWSAGGYYAYEAVKCLHLRGEHVDKLILIDTPCRNEFEALPSHVLDFLASKNLIGRGAAVKTPKGVASHFRATRNAVGAYVPSQLAVPAPHVYIIWASDALLPGDVPPDAALDLGARVTRFMLLPRTDFGPNGWEKMFPGGSIFISKMPGHHFNLVYPPNVASLTGLVWDVVQGNRVQSNGKWQSVNAK